MTFLQNFFDYIDALRRHPDLIEEAKQFLRERSSYIPPHASTLLTEALRNGWHPSRRITP